MAWPGLLISHLVWERTGQDLRWLAIEEWESLSLWGIDIPPDLIRRVFHRAFATYNILAMPSKHSTVTARAKSMRAALQTVKDGKVIGLMPEGDVGDTPALLPAREGVGSFLLMLAGAGAPVVPIGISEENERLVAHVGTPLDLTLPVGVPKTERDQWVRDRVMHAIRDLLPEPLWGQYSAKT
jgi:hypothetical protein